MILKSSVSGWMPGFRRGLYAPNTNAHGIKRSGKLRARTTSADCLDFTPAAAVFDE
jgi:hypothetical protein